MAFPQGINFRLTLGYVTDLSPDEFEPTTGVTYPRVTAQGNTVGWENRAIASDVRDRNAGNDARLAGIAFNGEASVDIYRFDLPLTGTYTIRTACGDANYAQNNTDLSLQDGAVSLGQLSVTSTTASQRFRDATDVEWTQITWPTSNVAVSKTFGTLICRFLVAAAGACAVTHLYIDGPTSVPPIMWFPQGQTSGVARHSCLPSGMGN